MTSYPLVTETLNTTRRCELLDVSAMVQSHVTRLKIHDGQVLLHVPHTTAAITINENADPDVQHDLLQKLQVLVPKNESFYRHDEGNSDSHLKSSLFHPTLTILIERSELLLGRWQGIYFAEFDGPRTRQLYMKFLSFIDQQS